MGKERGRKRGERMKGRGVVESGAGKREEGREERMERKYEPRKTEALTTSGDLAKEGRKWNGREEEE